MHDPMVVAFEIRLPWLRRCPRVLKDVRWRFNGRHVVLSGHWFRWVDLITVWHKEPGGHDSGEVCKMHRHVKGEGWQFYNSWRFHVHHWSLQVHPHQRLRRKLLTRCEWCGGRSSKGDPVNVSHQWDKTKVHWWQGEKGLFHQDCSSVRSAHDLCLCDNPVLDHGDYGRCMSCGKWRAFKAVIDDAHRALAALPEGGRLTAEARAFCEPVWEQRRRAQREAS